MVISKTLLLKGLGGASALLGTGGLVLFRKEIFGIKKEMDLSSFKDKELIDKVGLDCQLGDNVSLGDSETKECSVKTNGTINVKKGDQVEEGVSYSSGTQKLKVSRSTEGGYSKNLKFVVDSGDITLTKADAQSTSSISTLGQYETYGITESGGKFYLTRKTEANKEKQRELGLGECEFPESGSRDCSFTTEEIKKVKFDGQSDGVTVTGESVSLKISKTEDTSFTDGYRFTFTFPSEVSNPSVKANIPTDFKIKKVTDSNTLTLEKAWSDDNTFTKKAGLDCSNTSNECSVSTDDQKLNVKVGNKKKENIATINGGKIKIEKEKVGYNQGLKFTITTSDVTWTNGGQGDVTKLEELETYEITEEGGKYYLTRKEEANKTIKDSLGLPEVCNLPSSGSVDCVVQEAQSKNIKFDGKETDKPTGPLTLKIEKTNDNNFPKGYKFTLVSTSDVALSSTSTIKRNTNTVFKIKRKTSSNEISLEKAWTPTTLGAKVGLQNCSTNNECTLNNSGTLKVMQDDKKETSLNKDTSTNGKIKVYQDQEGYNQGFKFVIEDGRIGLTGSTKNDDSEKIKSLDEYETYEIKEEGNEWYLERKIKAQDFLKKELGLDNCSFPSSTIPETCSNIDLEKLKKIKFEGHSGHNWTESSAKVEIEITKEGNASTLPNGLKFIFKNNGNNPITVPTGSNKTTQIKKDGELDFKIKKTGSGSSVTLTLEKAWSINDLANNISGLTCTDNNNTKQCTVSSQISVWKDGSNYWKEATVSGSGTLTYEEGVKGFNKGFKLSSTSNISLTKNSSTNSYSVGDSNPFEVNVGYEITQATFGGESSETWCFKKKT